VEAQDRVGPEKGVNPVTEGPVTREPDSSLATEGLQTRVLVTRERDSSPATGVLLTREWDSSLGIEDLQIRGLVTKVPDSSPETGVLLTREPVLSLGIEGLQTRVLVTRGRGLSPATGVLLTREQVSSLGIKDQDLAGQDRRQVRIEGPGLESPVVLALKPLRQKTLNNFLCLNNTTRLFCPCPDLEQGHFFVVYKQDGNYNSSWKRWEKGFQFYGR